GNTAPSSTSPGTAAVAMSDPDQWAEAEAFRRLFEQTYPKLVAYARRRSFDAAAVDDAVSEVYATAWRRRAERDPAREPLPWLYGIAGNVLRNQWRADSRRLRLVERLETQPRPTVPGPAEVDADADRIRAALAGLTFDDQEVLRLVAWEGLSHAEVGEVLGCSTNAVGIRVHRARQRLEQQLGTGRPVTERSASEEEGTRGGDTR
ncbi:MAG: RNA polymerase sigma factor, partial [Actinomycetota bacterium]